MTPSDFKALREELGWTQSALAAALGTSIRAVKYYEAGQRKVPGPVRLLLKSVLEVSRHANA